MKLIAFLLFVVACEKSAPKPEVPKPIIVDTATPDAAVTEEPANAMANMLEGDESSKVDMTPRKPGDDLNRQVDAVRNPSKIVVVGGGSRRDDPSGPLGRISVASKQALDDSTLTADLVLAKIMSVYMAEMKRCYRAFLEKEPSARGKLMLSFTVNESGRAKSAQARGFAQPIDDCVTELMASWGFPIPKDKAGVATEASFLIGLQLVPD